MAKLYGNKKMKSARVAKGYSQEDMANLLALESGIDISVSTYQKYELASFAIPAERVLEIAKLLGAEPREIVDRK